MDWLKMDSHLHKLFFLSDKQQATLTDHCQASTLSLTSPASSSNTPGMRLTCLHFVLMSKHPGASVFCPAGPRRRVPLALSRTDAVPHAGGKSRSTYTGSVIWPSCSITSAAAPPETLQHFQPLFAAFRRLKKKKEPNLLLPSQSKYHATESLRSVTRFLPLWGRPELLLSDPWTHTRTHTF